MRLRCCTTLVWYRFILAMSKIREANNLTTIYQSNVIEKESLNDSYESLKNTEKTIRFYCIAALDQDRITLIGY